MNNSSTPDKPSFILRGINGGLKKQVYVVKTPKKKEKV